MDALKQFPECIVEHTHTYTHTHTLAKNRFKSLLWTHAWTNCMIKQKPEGRRPKEERRRRSSAFWRPPAATAVAQRTSASTDAHGEPRGYGEVISLPFPPVAIASLRTVRQRCCTPPQKIEVLHLFRCSTHTHTRTHPFPVWGTEHLSGGWVSPGVSLGYRRSYRQELDVNFQNQSWIFEEIIVVFMTMILL